MCPFACLCFLNMCLVCVCTLSHSVAFSSAEKETSGFIWQELGSMAVVYSRKRMSKNSCSKFQRLCHYSCANLTAQKVDSSTADRLHRHTVTTATPTTLRWILSSLSTCTVIERNELLRRSRAFTRFRTLPNLD